MFLLHAVCGVRPRGVVGGCVSLCVANCCLAFVGCGLMFVVAVVCYCVVACCSLLFVRGVPFVACCLLFAVCCLLFVCGVLFVVWCLLFVILLRGVV